jgi:hypothetical protein
MKGFILGLMLGVSVPAFAAGGFSTFERCFVASVTAYMVGYTTKATTDFKKLHPSPTEEEVEGLMKTITSEVSYSGVSSEVAQIARIASNDPKGMVCSMPRFDKVAQDLNEDYKGKFDVSGND